MEISYSELKQKDVVNIADGKALGKVCDLSFSFPEGRIIGFTVTGCKGFKFTKQEVFLPLKCVVKIGEDAVLVNTGGEQPPAPPNGCKKGDKNCSPPLPPCPPPPCPPYQPYTPPPPYPAQPNQYPPQSRRSFDEYE